MDMDFIQMAITVVSAVLASSGFWAFLQKRGEKKDVRTKLLVGLGHDRIRSLGTFYLDRGWMTIDEYENFHDYLYLPYRAAGGNGSAERIMEEVERRVKILDQPPIEGENNGND